MAGLGYTWYPENWWASDTFKRLKRFPMVRYAIRELFDLMYKEGGAVTMNRDFLYDDFNIELTDSDYSKLMEYVSVDEDGKWWIKSIKKRLTKAESARENGKNGGRPKGKKTEENGPKSETQKPSEITQAENPKNPSLESKSKSKSKIESKIKGNPPGTLIFENPVEEFSGENFGANDNPKVERYPFEPDPQKRVSTGPEFEAVEMFFIQSGFDSDYARSFFDRYETTGWEISGSEIKNWAALAQKWFREPDKYRQKTSSQPYGKPSRILNNLSAAEQAKQKLREYHAARNFEEG